MKSSWLTAGPYVSSHAKTFLTASRSETDSRSEAVHQPFDRLELFVKKNRKPFEWLELSVPKKSSALRTARPIRSTKIASRSNGSSYVFKKNCQPFERLELSVQKNCQPFEQLQLTGQKQSSLIRTKKSSVVRASAVCSKKKRYELCEQTPYSLHALRTLLFSLVCVSSDKFVTSRL